MIRDIEFETCGRPRYREEEVLVKMRHRLRSSSISDQELRLILNTYYSIKKEILLSGGILYEKGLGASFVDCRKISGIKSAVGFVPRLRTSVDDELKHLVIDLVKNSKDYRDVINFDPDRPPKITKKERLEREKRAKELAEKQQNSELEKESE